MATKTISITEVAYERLRARKREKESFSDVINRVTNKVSLLDFAGTLDTASAKRLENSVKELRAMSRKRAEKT